MYNTATQSFNFQEENLLKREKRFMKIAYEKLREVEEATVNNVMKIKVSFCIELYCKYKFICKRISEMSALNCNQCTEYKWNKCTSFQ